jgi:peptidylprolyl isomerase
LAVFLATTLGAAAAAGFRDDAQEPAMVKLRSGLQYADLILGKGPAPRLGQTCTVHYTGWLYENGKKGRKFESSLERGYPAIFPFGVGRVIKGWDEGLETMRPGGKRRLIVPPELGYSPREAGGDIPPHATLLFELELLEVK